MRRPLRIAIATGGRFHVLDLARELDALGHEVRFYSYVPRARAEKFGLPARCHVSLLPMMLPLVGWQRLLPKFAKSKFEWLQCKALNRAIMLRLQPCDVFIGMSGLILEAALAARRRFGARIYLERGSRHILSQREILAASPGGDAGWDLAVARELAGYEMADRITIASRHVAESFAERDTRLVEKLFVNPYGVDLEQFPLRGRRSGRTATVLYVGAWSYQKGADLLAEAIQALGDVRLVHVGALGDVAFPRHERLVHHEPVPQWRLAEFYAQADLFALASRQDGFGLVLVQALSSALPIVCTDRTGGRDLAHTPALAERIRVVPHGDATALAEAIRKTIEREDGPNPLPPLGEADRQALSWRAYGERYSEELERAVKPSDTRERQDHRA